MARAVVVALALLASVVAHQARAQECGHLYVGNWMVYLKTGQSYPVEIRPDGTGTAKCFMCMPSQRWTCSGNMFYVLDPYRIEHTLSADGTRLDFARGYALRQGPPPSGVQPPPSAAAPQPAAPPASGSTMHPGDPRFAWEQNPTRENCDKAVDRQSAYFGYQCGRHYFADGKPPPGASGAADPRAPAAPPPGQAAGTPKTLKPLPDKPTASAPDPAIPPPPPVAAYNDDDDGRECGQGDSRGHRARGQCFAPWDGRGKAECDALRGVFYAADGKGPAFCATRAPANPLQSADSRGCEIAGGSKQGDVCWIVGLTRDDCAALPGRLAENAGRQYCVYYPAAVAKAEADRKHKAARERLRTQLFRKFDS